MNLQVEFVRVAIQISTITLSVGIPNMSICNTYGFLEFKQNIAMAFYDVKLFHGDSPRNIHMLHV